MARLQGKSALITGGASGIGLATALRFQAEGARVAITDIDREQLIEASELLGEDGLAMLADAGSAADMAGVAEELETHLGGLDVLFANAGVALPMPLEEITEEHLDVHLHTNIKGTIFTVQRMLPLLSNPSSVILNASSLAKQGMLGMSIYSATKAAVRSLARSLSAELVGRGIRVNVVSPGPIETPIYARMGLPAELMREMAGQVVAKVPMGHFGQPEDIAAAALFLASDESRYMLGEELRIDGGMVSL